MLQYECTLSTYVSSVLSFIHSAVNIAILFASSAEDCDVIAV